MSTISPHYEDRLHLTQRNSLSDRFTLALCSGNRWLNRCSPGRCCRRLRIQRHQLWKNRSPELLGKVSGLNHLHLRSRRRSTPTAVFCYAYYADLGFLIGVHRGKAYEPRMIFMLFSAHLFLRNHLGGSSLAAGINLAREANTASGTTLVYDTPHSV